MAEQGRERDLVLGPTEYAMIQDETKGNITVYVGPQKTSLSNTDRPVVFDPQTGTFARCELAEAIKVFPTADEGAYIVLSNPAVGSEGHPKTGSNMPSKLEIGRKVNIPGPTSFPLWPGQTATVIPGHRLRSNEYLIVRVYNDMAATENWSKAVMKPQTAASASGELKSEGSAEEAAVPSVQAPQQLTMGQLLVIQGTKVSFYIPPTGVEVVPDVNGKYVRGAVTLEQLEYCILLDESGKSRYVTGPAVVFPAPTETFVERDGSRKFRAIELNENMGLYLKVIAPYKDDGGTEHEAGEELFITGKEQKLYFQRPEHSIIKYGDEEIHFAVAVPEGDARYVLDKRTGQINLVKGPQMFLSDPRHQVLVRRVIDPKTVELWFPGNREALDYNAKLASLTRVQTEQFVTEREALTDLGLGASSQYRSVIRSRAETAQKSFGGPALERREDFTPPRTITLDTKYEGAVAINVWTGYAVQVVSKTGDRRVVIGSATVLLEYNETLEVLEMSTGTPKSDTKPMHTVYLRVLNNKVSDRVDAETEDLVQVSVTLSYRVNFEGEAQKWFDVDNYVKLLVEHLRSMIRNAVKQHGIEEFNRNAISIIRDTVLGTSGTGEGEGTKSRAGRLFDENGMRVYDVEVLDVTIGDGRIASLLVDAQHQSVQQALEVARAERDLDKIQRLEEVARKRAEAEATTALHGLRLAQEKSNERLKLDLASDEIQRQRNASKSETELHELQLSQQRVAEALKLELAEIGRKAKAREDQLTAEFAAQQQEAKVAEGRLAMSKAEADQENAIAAQSQKLELEKLDTEVRAVVEKAKAFGPEVVSALQSFAHKDLAGKACQSMAPLSILGGGSIAEIVSNMLSGTVLEGVMKLANANGNTPHQTTGGRVS